jgi:hypothetical protein
LTSSLYAGPKDGLRGPDFMLAPIDMWDRDAGDNLRIKLAGDGLWSMAHDDRFLRPTIKILELASQRGDAVFVSGDASSGRIERVILPQRLTLLNIAPTPSAGRRTVMFLDSMSVYYLYEDRPWAPKALELFESLLAQQKPGKAVAPILVAIDVVTSEIVAVRE